MISPDIKLPDGYTCTSWLVLGIDPSMSRTGYAFMTVENTDSAEPRTKATWLNVGSVKGDSADPEWQRAKMYAQHMKTHLYEDIPGRGLLIAMEYPTPTNTFLVQLNRIIHLEFFKNPEFIHYRPIRFLMLNASTVRSVYGLKQRGARNKVENIARAYDFIDQKEYPGLDTDSCDGVLMAMFGRYTASVLMGNPEEVPSNFLNALCSGVQEIKRKGRPSQYTVTKGLLHRSEYFYGYQQANHQIFHKDAKTPPKQRLVAETYGI